ncbi:MAG TPA: hypothetical protein VH682_29560 [Gemmataceae bacterium]|jgi:hypothetical protein
MKTYAVWFGRALWLGVVVDWVLGIPAIFAPDWTLRTLREQPSPEPAWVAFASLLLVLLSFFYIPIASEPYRFPALARLAVASRLLQALFLLALYTNEYPDRGLVNLALFAVQLPLLVMSHREAPRPGIPEKRAPAPVTADDLHGYDGSTFAEVKDVVFSSPYKDLPYHHGLGLSTFLQFYNASARNLVDRRDIRPYFDKLIHTHGICYTGVWEIDQESPYTGYFAQSSKGLLLARLSVAGPRLRQGQRRAFGIAGKIFPTMDPDRKVQPGNFVTVSHLSGDRAKHILDITVTNAPTIGLDPAANFVNRVIFRMMDTRPGLRLLYPISTLGVPRGQPVVTPDLLMLRVAERTPRVNAIDFREELRLKHYPGHQLIYTINVKNFADRDWTRLGRMTFTEDVISEGGDKRLHFWIPSDLPSHN